MKKSKGKKQAHRNKSAGQTEPNEGPQQPSRRDFMGTVRNVALGGAGLGAVGFFVVRTVTETMAEHDLTRIANGTPSVVQVHDPNCSLCKALQRETKKALGEFEDGQITYMVANIKGADGRAFAAKYGVPHVTLLLFDSKGDLQDTLHGRHTKEELVEAFQALVRLEAQS